MLDSEEVNLCVPSLFLAKAELSGGMRLLMYEKETLLKYAERNSVTRAQLKELWPKWVKICLSWHARVTRGMHREWPNEDYPIFVEDLLR